MLRAGGASAGGDRRGDDALRIQVIQRRRGADDVDDGVDAPDLVEVDLVQPASVDLGLCLSELLEDPLGAFLHPRG
jgi:uncharacterized Ntn-hydrolase superfamily protein